MRVVSVVLCLAVLVACGGAKTPDGGVDGGLGGGLGGGFGGGGAGGGVGGGTGTETVSITVVEGPAPGTPVAGAMIRLSGPNAIAQGATNDAGVALIILPSNERPLDVTVARAGYGALSVLNSDVVPASMRIDKLAPAANPTTGQAGGLVSGKQAAANRVLVDGYLFNTATSTANTWATTYAVAAYPLELVALELSDADEVVSYAVSQPFVRAGPITWDVILPIGAPTIRSATHTLTFPAAGFLTTAFTSLGDAQVSKQSPFEAGNWIMSGFAQLGPVASGTLPVKVTAVDGKFLPDRAYLAFGNQPAQSVLNVVLHEPTTARNVVLPRVDALALTGTTLANVSATASAAPGFDTLELSVGKNGQRDVPSWRCYTAKGKPFTIRLLPTLPSGVTPADIGITGPMDALAMLVGFEDPSMQPWLLKPSEFSQPDYRLTLSVGYATIAPTWR